MTSLRSAEQERLVATVEGKRVITQTRPSGQTSLRFNSADFMHRSDLFVRAEPRASERKQFLPLLDEEKLSRKRFIVGASKKSRKLNERIVIKVGRFETGEKYKKEKLSVFNDYNSLLQPWARARDRLRYISIFGRGKKNFYDTAAIFSSLFFATAFNSCARLDFLLMRNIDVDELSNYSVIIIVRVGPTAFCVWVVIHRSIGIFILKYNVHVSLVSFH